MSMCAEDGQCSHRPGDQGHSSCSVLCTCGGTELLGPCSKTRKLSSQTTQNYQELNPKITLSLTHKILLVLFCVSSPSIPPPSPGVLLQLGHSM